MAATAYSEPHKFSAGALALAVHGVFFSLLFFGFNWHVKPPQSMVVEMWDHLPDPVSEVIPEPPAPPVLPPAEAPVPPKPVEAVVVPKAEIEIKIKDKKKIAKLKKDTESAIKATVAQARQEADKKQAADARAAQEEERIQTLRAKMRAEIDAATQGEVARYTDLIRAKIKNNIVTPPDVAANAEAIFRVVVLPGGSVMDNVKLEKSSGNAAYDSAAERAIYKAQPLPLPQDPAIARLFRELRLSVKP